MGNSSTQHHSLVTASVNGISWGTFESRTGGATTSEVGKYRPGGFQKQKARRGLPETEDVTIAREWERERDYPLSRQRNLVGLADVVVSDQPLDDLGAPWGKPTVFTGVLQQMTDGDSDANSNDAKTLELVVSVLEVN